MKFKRRFYRKFRYNRKRSFMFIFLFLLCLSFGLGYSLISTDLNIFGTTVLKDNRWDVHFDNIQEGEDSVSPTVEPEITDNTTVTFSAKLKNPGDKYEFLIDVVNAGTIDAKIGNISMSPILTEEQQNFFSYNVTYVSKLELQEEQALDAGTSETLKVIFKYLEQEDNSLYPDTDQTFNVVLTIDYVQGTGEEVIHPYLYNVFSDESLSNVARKYTGPHHDSFTEEPSKDVYYWRSTGAISKRNVLFAGYCWQTFRTTDTGGVKMIYNGEPLVSTDGDNTIYNCGTSRGTHIGFSNRTTQTLNDSYYYGTEYVYNSDTNLFSLSGDVTTGFIKTDSYTCKSTSRDGTCASEGLYYVESVKTSPSYYVYPIANNISIDEVGLSIFNNSSPSISDEGYMYNKKYNLNTRSTVIKISLLRNTLRNNSATYYYADSITWDSNNSVYVLSNVDSSPVLSGAWDDVYPSIAGKYMCTGNSSCTSVMYVSGNSSSYYYNLLLSNGELLSNKTIKVGDSYSYNNGIYELNSLTTVNLGDWYSTRSSYIGKYICSNANDTSCSTLHYISNVNEYQMHVYSSDNNFKYANTFNYRLDENTGTFKYYLDVDGATVQDWILSYEMISNHHYTCWNASGECDELHYFARGLNDAYTIVLQDGKGVEDALVDMLSSDDVNRYNSLAKNMTDLWFSKYMTGYTNYLEDTIFCNRRDILALNNFNPNGGSTSNYLTFSQSSGSANTIDCPNETDKFSLSNPKAKLVYPVGLITFAEANLLYYNALRASTMHTYWTMSAHFFNVYAHMRTIVYNSNNAGTVHYAANTYSNGIRPVISLKPGTVYIAGTGTEMDPFIIE